MDNKETHDPSEHPESPEDPQESGNISSQEVVLMQYHLSSLLSMMNKQQEQINEFEQLSKEHETLKGMIINAKTETKKLKDEFAKEQDTFQEQMGRLGIDSAEPEPQSTAITTHSFPGNNILRATNVSWLKDSFKKNFANEEL
eukprot:CAMPEP_0178954408 /NCGR_PEP_ID=MMETSP0789-20121207/8968_1 /TAXON_ID=3005 /ORGANISM="Rhizosolenia setigera, Strain CCMP 1694" /LENGTH=142 /DNA_ID=CAMNT_0020635795 /DNA_START=67 /DNA_END=495 /DNA_ORIENTATION=+